MELSGVFVTFSQSSQYDARYYTKLAYKDLTRQIRKVKIKGLIKILN